MAKIDFKALKNKAQKDINLAKDLKELDEIFRKYLGEKGELRQILHSLKDLPQLKRKETGKLANQIKKEIEETLKKKKSNIQNLISNIQKQEWVDITIPGKKLVLGHLHPLTQVKKEVEEIFQSMGFSVVEGPEIENEWYNFDALNIPKDHPARDVWDTFWLQSNQKIPNPKSQIFTPYRPALLKKGGAGAGRNPKIQKLLLRTHTSPMQIRYMEKNQPPLRIIVPGSVFRHEATDTRHEFQLYQVEGLMVDKEISVANLKAILAEFFKRFFGKNTAFRLDPDFFPFTEPSFNVSVTCVICEGKGCNLCKKTGWLEMAGAGMVHPNVFKNSGLNLNPPAGEWRGWAFGFGLERLAMMKYKIDDVRLFRSGDLRFLNQF